MLRAEIVWSRIERFLDEKANLPINEQEKQLQEEIFPIVPKLVEMITCEIEQMSDGQKKDVVGDTLHYFLVKRLEMIREVMDPSKNLAYDREVMERSNCPEEKFAEFDDLLDYVGFAYDEESLLYKKQLKELGVSAMMPVHDGKGGYWTREQEIAFLEDPETQKILKDPMKYSII
ncbi:MAG: hypothetical protein WCP93_02410 [Candidatus Berkelbacteria bacterium]